MLILGLDKFFEDGFFNTPHTLSAQLDCGQFTGIDQRARRRKRDVECLGDLGESEESLIHGFYFAIFSGEFAGGEALSFDLFVQIESD